jgi:hypothetical protein
MAVYLYKKGPNFSAGLIGAEIVEIEVAQVLVVFSLPPGFGCSRILGEKVGKLLWFFSLHMPHGSCENRLLQF